MKRDQHYHFTVNGAGDSAELMIYDDIGQSWFGGITAKQVADDIRAAGKIKTLRCRINSQGGDVFEAFAIYNQLVNHSAKVIVSVEGLAASSASVIAMAGNEIEIGESAWMMIHDPWTVAMGNAVDMREAATLLDDISTTIRNIYADRTGLDPAELKRMMRDETWMDGKDAVAKGFATKMNANLKVAAALTPQFRAAYRHAPALLETEPDDRVNAAAMLAQMNRDIAGLTGRG